MSKVNDEFYCAVYGKIWSQLESFMTNGTGLGASFSVRVTDSGLDYANVYVELGFN